MKYETGWDGLPGAFVQYVHPSASTSRSSRSKPTRGESGPEPVLNHDLQAPAREPEGGRHSKARPARRLDAAESSRPATRCPQR